MPNNTLTYDEKAKGWTSFHSFEPEFMIGMNNKFFSFKNGDLYEHHSTVQNTRNRFYGVENIPSKISVIVNDSPSEIKELQAVSLEGNSPWETSVKAFISNSDDFTESSIKKEEYLKKEGIWFAYARRNESETQLDSKATYGLGTVVSINLSAVSFQLNGGNTLLCVGDDIMSVVPDTEETVGSFAKVGTIVAINGVVIVMNTLFNIMIGDFVIGRKNARIEGGNLRGYAMRLDLEIQKDTKAELFAVNTEVKTGFSKGT